MGEPAIFAVGGVLFIATTWATIAFGLTRVMRLEDEVAEEEPIERGPYADN